MDRLEDIIYELDGQLTPLRAQRDVALKFRELDARRTQLDISVLVAQIIAEKVSYESAQAQLKMFRRLWHNLMRHKKSLSEMCLN